MYDKNGLHQGIRSCSAWKKESVKWEPVTNVCDIPYLNEPQSGKLVGHLAFSSLFSFKLSSMQSWGFLGCGLLYHNGFFFSLHIKLKTLKSLYKVFTIERSKRGTSNIRLWHTCNLTRSYSAYFCDAIDNSSLPDVSSSEVSEESDSE